MTAHAEKHGGQVGDRFRQTYGLHPPYPSVCDLCVAERAEMGDRYLAPPNRTKISQRDLAKCQKFGLTAAESASTLTVTADHMGQSKTIWQPSIRSEWYFSSKYELS